MATRILIAVLLSSGCCLSAEKISVNRMAHQAQPHATAPRSLFRYVITQNQIADGIRPPEGGTVKFRGVDVLLDAKSFSEGNLRQLVELLSKRFPDPKHLVVNVYTNLDDMLTPEENDVPASGSVDFSAPKYPWALYIRSAESEHFSYHSKVPGSLVKTVKLRGKER